MMHYLKYFNTYTMHLLLLYGDMIYMLTVINLTPGDNSTVHIYTQTKHRTTQNKQ